MLVLFLLIALVFNVSVSQRNKQVALKDQLARSITHVSEILFDIEHKIGGERKILAQMDNDLNALRGTTNEFDITIFWDNATTEAVTDVPGQSGNFSYTIKTTPSLFPPPSINTLTTLPENWFSTKPGNTKISPYIEDVMKTMAKKQYGYFGSFIDEATELIFTKDIKDSYPVTALVTIMIRKGIKEGTFKSLGEDLLTQMDTLLFWFHSFTPERVKQQAEVLHHSIQMKDKTWTSDQKNLLNFYDKMFTKEQGYDLHKALEVFYIYPAENISLTTVAEGIYHAAFAPYFKFEGTRKQKRLVQFILMAVHDFYPEFRSQTEANQTWKDHNQLPERRSMNYKKVIKHFLFKHPKLFKKIKRQYKHDKKNKNHHLSHKQKRHHNYRKSRGRYHRYEHIKEREPITKRAHKYIRSKQENDNVEEDSSKSGAYYGKNLGGENYQQKNMHKVQFTQKSKKLHDKLRQRKLLKGTRTAPLSIVEQPDEEQAGPQYLKQLAIRFLSKRQKSQDFHRNRRFNVPSAEEDICNHSQFIQDSIENSNKLHKIREVSSYSDEEDYLRTNLYDALRHGNRTFESFRRSGNDIINKKTIQDVSSEPDDEWVIKNNIYKVFEQGK